MGKKEKFYDAVYHTGIGFLCGSMLTILSFGKYRPESKVQKDKDTKIENVQHKKTSQKSSKTINYNDVKQR